MKKFLDTHGFHRKLEGWPLVFTVLTTIAVAIGGIVEFLPLILVDDQVEAIATVEPFTPLELAGRDLYIREGCVGCHSQMVRPFRHEMERYGDYSKPGETVYESPFLWGSKRTGPDLARVGGKYPHLWHVRHMENPRSTSPRSIMPPYPWLLTRPIDFDRIPGKLSALQTVGLPYSDEEVEDAVALARAQAEQIAADVVDQGGPAGLEDKEITALVAYLQKLGTFLDDVPAPAERDLEPHEREEIRETMQDEQPGDLPGTELEVEELPEGVDPRDVDMERTDEGSVVDDEAVDELLDDGSTDTAPSDDSVPTDDGQEAPDAP
jgi:cbb3-type cytochrome c oxidase subunit II